MSILKEKCLKTIKDVQWMEVVLAVGICITSIICVLFLSNGDNRIIASWGRTFFYSLKGGGSIEQFATNAYFELGLEANYSLVTYVFLAVLYFPVYLIELLTQNIMDIRELMVYYNFLMVLGLIPLAKGLIDVFRINLKRAESYFLIAFVMLSPAMQIAEIGKGQIDIISLIIMVYAYKAYLKDENFKMCLLISVGCLFKPFCILMFVPMIIDYIISNRFLEWLKGVFIIVALYIIQSALEYLYMGNYLVLRKASDLTFFNRFFGGPWEDFVPYIFLTFLVIGIHFVLRMRGIVSKKHTLIFASLMYVLMYVFTIWNEQYLSYGLVVFALLFSHWYNSEIMIPCLTIFNICFAILLILHISGTVGELSIQTMNSFMGNIWGEDQKYIGDYIIQKPYYWSLRKMASAGLMVSIVVVLIDIVIQALGKTKRSPLKIPDGVVKVLGLCQVLPTAFFIIIAYGAQRICI